MGLFRAGQTLANGAIEIIDQLGSGGFGEVYLALWRKAEGHQRIAIKCFNTSGMSQQDLMAAQLLHRESVIIGALDHPGAVKILGASIEGSIPYLIEEYLPGKDLQRLLAERSLEADGPVLSPLEILNLGMQIAKALEVVHGKGIFHGDLKPSNICFRDLERSEVVLVDFGHGGFHDSQLLEQEVAATLAYLPPERTGFVKLAGNASSDLYSLGVTLYEAASGAPPFRADAGRELIARMLSEVPKALAQRFTQFPEPLSDIIQKLLRKNPEERYHSAFGLFSDLERCRAALLESANVRSFALGTKDKLRELNYKIPIVGRRRELDQLSSSLRQTIQGQGQALFIGAPSGAGKSRLAHELMHQARGHQLAIMAAKFSEFERNLPLSAFSLLLMEHAVEIQTYPPSVRQAWMKHVRTRLGWRGQLLAKRFAFYEGILPPFPPIPLQEQEQQDESHVFHATLAEFLTLLYPEGAGHVILLDDLQWADWQSLAVVRELCLLGLREGMGCTLFLGTYRSNEVDERHPLQYQVLQEMPQQQMIQLGPLSREEADELVQHLLDEAGPEIQRLQESTFQLTAGNPFHIYEYLKSAIASGVFVLDEVKKTWSFSPERAMQSGMTQGVAGLVADRIKRLTGLSRDLILAASVAGNSVNTDALAYLLQSHYPLVVEEPETWQRQLELARDELIHKHLILPHDRKLIFFHDKIREAAYDQVDAAMRRDYHRAYGYWMALALLENGPAAGQKDYFEAAFHVMAGDAKQDAPLNRRLLFAAAKAAAAIYAYAKAREFLRFAADLFPEAFDRDPATLQEWVALHELWANLLAVSEQIDDALKLYDRVLAHVEDPVQRAQIYARQTEYNLAMFRYKDSLDAVMGGLKALDVGMITSEWYAWLYIFVMGPLLGLYAVWFYFFGRQTRDIEDERERIHLHLRIKLEIPFYFSYPMVAIANVIPLTFRLMKYRDNVYRATVFVYWGIALTPFGLDRLARFFFHRGSDYFDRTNNPVDKGFALFVWGYVHDFMVGNLKGAHSKLSEAVKTLTPVGESFWRSLSLMGLIHIDQYGGETGQAKELTSELVELWKRIRYVPTPLGCCLRVYLQDKRDEQVEALIRDTFEAKEGIRREGFDSIDTVFACLAPGEIYALRGDVAKADPLFREALTSALKHGHRAAYALLAPVQYAWNLIRMKRHGRAFLVLLFCWFNQLLRARIFYPQTLYASGEWFHGIGLPWIGTALIQKGIRWAFQRRWLVIVAEGRQLIGRLLIDKAPDIAEVNLQLARDYYVGRDQTFSIEQCDNLLSLCRFKTRDITRLQETTSRVSRSLQGQRTPQLRQRLESHALLEVFLKLSALTDRESLLEALLDALCSCTGAEFALVFLRGKQGWEPIFSRHLKLKQLVEQGYYKLGIDKAFLEHCWEHQLDIARIRPPQWQKNEQLSRGSVLVLPLVYRKTVYGYCYLANSQIYDLFDSRSIDTVAPLCAQAAIALQNLQLIAETQEKVKLDAEMMAARAMQESLLPHQQSLPGLKLSSYYRSASQTGGDWLGYFHHEPLDTAFICIGDVTGHGIPSALITGVVCGAVYASEFWLGQTEGSTITDRLLFLARAVNETVCRTGTRSGCLMTMCFLAIERKTGAIHVLNAGHVQPYLMHKGAVQVLKSRGNRLGHTQDPEFQVTTHAWARGDRLFLYTDGLLENQGPDGEIFKIRQLERLLTRDSPLDDLQTAILSSGEKIWQDVAPEDDVSFLLVEWPEPGKTEDAFTPSESAS